MPENYYNSEVFRKTMTMRKHLLHGTCITLLIFHCTSAVCPKMNDTHVPDMVKLHRKLLKYKEIVKPGAFNDIIDIQLILFPTYLQQLNTAKQIFSIVGLLGFYWHHESLAWDPEDYGGVFAISVPAVKIWKPGFLVRNSAISNIFEESTINKHQVFIDADGYVSWLVSDMFTTTCEIEPEYFPFDTQQCEIRISGDETMNENFTALKVDIREFLNSSDWILVDVYVLNVYDPFADEMVMSFGFKFKRRPDFYIVTMVMPLIILSTIGLLTFLLPVDSGEKMSLGMACLLSFVVIQTSVTPYLPTSYSTMPYIVMLIFALMVFNALSISTTIIMISVLSMEPHPKMPDWLDRVHRKSGKVKEIPKSTPEEIEDVEVETEEVDAVQKSQMSPADVKECFRGSGEQEQLDEKWKGVFNFINKCLFLLFSITFIILICTIFAVWILGAKSASKMLSKSV